MGESRPMLGSLGGCVLLGLRLTTSLTSSNPSKSFRR